MLVLGGIRKRTQRSRNRNADTRTETRMHRNATRISLTVRTLVRLAGRKTQDANARRQTETPRRTRRKLARRKTHRTQTWQDARRTGRSPELRYIRTACPAPKTQTHKTQDAQDAHPQGARRTRRRTQRRRRKTHKTHKFANLRSCVHGLLVLFCW